MGENCGTLKLASTNGVGPLFLKTGLPCFSGRKGNHSSASILASHRLTGEGDHDSGGRGPLKIVSGK